jgi:putative nucleotidyltransferase with HDIG domain
MMVDSNGVSGPGQGQPQALIAVDIQSFRNATRDINFEVYLKLSEENYAHVFSRTTGLDYKRLAQYIQKGVTQLHIKREDQGAYQAFVARPAHAIFEDPNTPNEKKIATLLNMTEQNMAELFTQVAVSEDTAATSQRVIRNYVDLMTQSPNTLAIILKLVSHGEYLYYHSIAVAIFSMFIAKASGQFNSRTYELVGMGGFLHDIGCTQLPKEVSCSPTDLTEEQWDQMHGHPKLGLRLIENTPSIPDEVRHIVYQHHEQPSGKGYPNGLHSATIYYPAKIVALADAFSALISKRPFRPAYTVEQAFAILQSGEGRHDRELVKMVASIFLRSGTGAASSTPGSKAA